MQPDMDSLLGAWPLVGHASYLLLIVSMTMRRMLPLRLLAVASGLLGLAYSVIFLSDWVSGVWESAFVLVNLAQVSLLLVERARRRWTPEELALRHGTLASLADHEFTRLLRAGDWRDMGTDDLLTEQGEPVSALLLLVDGHVAIRVDGRPIATCRRGDFIGELSFLTERPATATAVAASDGRYLRFDRERLRALLDGDPELDRAVAGLFNRNLVRKLAETTGGLD